MDVQPWQARLPNQLTFCRVAAVPVLAAAFYAPQAAAARVPAMLFGVIAFTDFLDGFLARRWQVESALGAFLDPVADKFVVCTTFVLLSGALGAVVAAPTALVICREIGVSALRERLAVLGAAKSAAPADLEPWASGPLERSAVSAFPPPWTREASRTPRPCTAWQHGAGRLVGQGEDGDAAGRALPPAALGRGRAGRGALRRRHRAAVDRRRAAVRGHGAHRDVRGPLRAHGVARAHNRQATRKRVKDFVDGVRRRPKVA